MNNLDDEEEILEFELNHKQADFFEKLDLQLIFIGVKQIAAIGGVGSGKTFTNAILLKRFFEELPRATVQFACNAVVQTKRSITPELKSTWEQYLHCHEYNPSTGSGEYVLWKKPPDVFDKPYRQPDNYDNCISHIRGTVVEFCGYAVQADAHRSRNDDALIIDEASRFKREWLKVAKSRVRANVGKFESNLHHLCVYFSNPNYNPEGDWIWEFGDLELVQPDRYGFVHTCTMDNLRFLPKGYVEDKKLTMLDFEYDVEILGKRVTRIKNSYYSALKWGHHANIDESSFYSPSQPLTTSIDFNVTFTSCTMWQQEDIEHRCINNLFVKEPKADSTMAETLAHKVNEVFANHQNKTLYVTGDRNGLNTSAGSKLKSNGQYETQFDQFCNIMESLGWQVILQPLNYNPPKNEVHALMQDILLENGREDIVLRFHPQDAKQTLISMTFTPIKDDFGKDKKSERRRSLEQENATHLSDTVDYYALYIKNGGYVYVDGGFEVDFI
jgi:hypothetical protein